MSVLEVIIIGVALATDAFALTVANCAAYEKNLSRKKEWAMPCAFAAFQFFMPVIGFFIGSAFTEFLRSFAKFLTAGVFFLLALKIILDAIENRSKSKTNDFSDTRQLTLKTLFIQAVATSIDALAVGVTFAAELKFSVFIAAVIIGGVTFIIVATALFIGKSLGKLLGKYAVWLGAVILFALAVKNMAEGVIAL